MNIFVISWIMLHTFAEKIKPEIYIEKKTEIIDFLKELYNSYPCKNCCSDALSYLNTYNKPLDTQADFKIYLFEFHQHVNKKLHKTYQDISILKQYEKANINKIFTTFIENYRLNDNINKFLLSHKEWFN